MDLVRQIKTFNTDLVKQIADFIRTYEFGHGDQYGSWIGPSEDAEELAKAIEANFGYDLDDGAIQIVADRYLWRAASYCLRIFMNSSNNKIEYLESYRIFTSLLSNEFKEK